MASSREIKQRIKSAKNISKITKAMEMVSASKMRRAQEQANLSRPYSHNLQTILQKISQYTDSSLHPLLETHESGIDIVVLVSTDRGLCGGLNANLFRAVSEWMKNHPTTQIVVIGKKAKNFCRVLGLPVYAEFVGLPDKISYADTLPISTLVLRDFEKLELKSVHLLHMQSVTTITQQPIINQLLPISPAEIDNPSELVTATAEYMFEPSPREILNWLLPYYVENEVYFTLLEAKASEHSARMMAMKNASDNAKEIVSGLNLEYNRTRQAHITQELQEITTATLALG